MGLDAEIILETGNVETIITINHKIRDVHHWYTDKIYNDQFQLNGDYAQFRTMWRYWGPGYERGPWYSIYGVIRTAMGFCNVYYGSDSELDFNAPNCGLELVTVPMLNKYWEHFISKMGTTYRDSILGTLYRDEL